LWIDLTQEHAHACLRTTLWRLSQVGCPVVEVTSTHLTLASDVTVDVHELEASAASILHGGAPATSHELDLLTHAAELLPDWYSDWVLQERERVHQLRLVALETIADELIGVRRYSEAGMAALAAVGSDPLRESAHRLLIRSYLGEGNAAEALRHFEVFRTELQRLYGLQPSLQMRELIQEIGGRCR
jgi:DNA-binding SARP family transcriptional activator